MRGRAPPIRLLRSTGARHGLAISAAMLGAGALDYGSNIVAARGLAPVEFGVFVTVTALLQVLLLLSIAIRMVVAFYTAERTGAGKGPEAVSSFVQFAWSWAWRWGLAASLLMALTSPLWARALRLPSAWPVLVASAMIVVLFVREVTYGALQGVQAFEWLGAVQVAQAAVRIALVAGFVALRGSASAAIAAQPLACFAAIAFALWPLRPYFERRRGGAAPPVSWRYSTFTVVGLAAFGVVTNLDALFVKRFFEPEVAGDYGVVVTVAKVALFLPWAVGIVLFPKVAKRRAAGMDPRPLLLVALAVALTPGLGMTALCFLHPGRIVATVFGPEYADPGVVLGLAVLAATLYAGIHIWLNYALSLERKGYAYVLVGVLLVQALGMLLLARGSLVVMTLVMVACGFLGNVAGYVATSPAPTIPQAARDAAVAGG